MSDKDEALRLADAIEAPDILAGAFRHEVAACLRRQHAEIESLKAECDALRAELVERNAARNAYASEFPPDHEGKHNVGIILLNIRNLKSERDALRADAERYRWLRSDVATAENYPIACMRDGGWLLLGDELDAAIDAAREAGK